MIGASTVVMSGYHARPESLTASARMAMPSKTWRSTTCGRLYLYDALFDGLAQHVKDMPCALGALIGSRSQHPDLDGLRGSRASASWGRVPSRSPCSLSVKPPTHPHSPLVARANHSLAAPPQAGVEDVA
jgi:hypothetical protein